MELNGNDFTLHFEGLQSDSPEVLREFKAICLADLALSVEDTISILSTPGEKVLCRKDSHEDLERLAQHLRSIGARVDVRGPLRLAAPTEPANTTIANLEDFNKLFYDSTPLNSDLRPMPGDVSPSEPTPSFDASVMEPVGPVVAHFTSDVATATPPPQVTTLTREENAGTTQSKRWILAAIAGVLTLTSFTVAWTRTAPDVDHIASSAYLARQKLEEAATAALAVNRSNLSWSWSGEKVNPQGYQVKLSTLQVADISSVRLTITPKEGLPVFTSGGERLRFRRAESDPAVLQQTGPERWEGLVPLYIFIERGGERVRLVGAAHVTVTGGDAPSARAIVTYPAEKEPSQDEPTGMRLEGSEASGYRFWLHDTVPLVHQ